METSKVDTYIIANAKFFKSEQIPFIRERLLAANDSKWVALQSIPLKDSTTSLTFIYIFRLLRY